MSKKKSKTAATKAPKKQAAQRAKAPRAAAASGKVDASGGKTVYATIFIYRTGNGTKIKTSPQRIYANPNDRIEWSVVNTVDGSDVPVTITWPGEGPWGKQPIEFRNYDCKPVDGAAAGRYKYVVSALGAQEDPEVEIPDI
ncbi:MAG: hypothetical protein K2Y23_14170 [Cyanobacteria bacterium]|nr:hypothetical protein [Cyanobacteriota bacterium]